MLLSNVHITGKEGVYDIHIREGKIQSIDPCTGTEEGWNMQGALAFPGLINSHDHLEFNCYSYTGNRKYANYRDWGNDIQQNNRAEIDRVLRIPEYLRMRWGMYKNMINGVTTVVHHGKPIARGDYPVHIVQSCQSLHSVGFEPRWKWKLNHPLKMGIPVAMHVGEGTDELAKEETRELLRWNLLKRKIVAVHGVGMTEDMAKGFHALAWCPATNFFLLGATAQVDKLKKHLPIIFGTDSTLTASWNIWDQLREARATALLNDEELLDSVTREPSAVWNLHERGTLSPGMMADIVITQSNDFFSTDPCHILLVLREGRPELADPVFEGVINNIEKDSCNTCFVQGIKKYVRGDIAGLIKEVRHWCPGIELPVTV